MIALPLAGAVVVSIIGHWKPAWMPWSALVPLLGSAVLGCLLITRFHADTVILYQLGDWPPPLGIELRVDYLSFFLMLLIAGIGLLALIYSRRYIVKEVSGNRLVAYYVLILLIVGGLLGFVAAGDIFNLFVFMEIVAISSYSLVAITAGHRAVRAALRYLLMGAPASIIILLGIGFLYQATGSLNFAELTGLIARSGYRDILIASFVLFVIGFGVKGALFPLHIWLPDAHSIAPSPVSAVLSGLVVESAAFAILRIAYSVFTTGSADLIRTTFQAVAILAAAGLLFGGVMALLQKDLKLMLAYSTISHVGYIFLGITTFNQEGVAGGMFHMLDHGLAKACLFLCAGSFIYKKGYRRIEDLKGAWRQMPWTAAAFGVAAFSLVGVPPTAGFIGKWYLVLGNAEAGNWAYVAIILIGSLLGAFYCFRVLYYMFFQPGPEGMWSASADDSPEPMLVPIWILAGATLFFGIFSYLVIPSLLRAVSFLF
jgi:multicomponent Na+:H+ antiporter subunit D